MRGAARRVRMIPSPRSSSIPSVAVQSSTMSPSRRRLIVMPVNSTSRPRFVPRMPRTADHAVTLHNLIDDFYREVLEERLVELSRAPHTVEAVEVQTVHVIGEVFRVALGSQAEILAAAHLLERLAGSLLIVRHGAHGRSFLLTVGRSPLTPPAFPDTALPRRFARHEPSTRARRFPPPRELRFLPRELIGNEQVQPPARLRRSARSPRCSAPPTRPESLEPRLHVVATRSVPDSGMCVYPRHSISGSRETPRHLRRPPDSNPHSHA